MGPFYGKAGNQLTDVLDPPTGSLVLGSHDNIYAPGGKHRARSRDMTDKLIVIHRTKRFQRPSQRERCDCLPLHPKERPHWQCIASWT